MSEYNYSASDPIDSLLSNIPPCMEEDDSAMRQREVIESNRVKLVQYIHDITLLFPYMKEKTVFSVDDCDIIKNEVTTSGKVDKFLDILLTKGPKAIGVFHEALHPQYPHVFDYLTRLLTNAGVELPPDRRLRETEEEKLSVPIMKDPTPELSPPKLYPFRHHGSKTIRRSLDILSKHCNTMQRERDDLHKVLEKKEEEISNLLSSREYIQSNLLSVTQKYQQLLEELVNWKDFVSNQSDHSYQKMLREHQSIQTEYDELEANYNLNSSELSAARDRIMQLLSQVERSENVISILQEERDQLMDKVTKLEAQQHSTKGTQKTTSIDIKSDDIVLALETELQTAKRDNSCLQEQLTVVQLERKGALDERDALVSQLYKEKEENKRLEKEIEALKTAMNDGTSIDYNQADYYNYTPVVDAFDQTTVTLSTAEAQGMAISLGFIVRSVSLVASDRLKVGDEIVQINSIKLNAVDARSLEFAHRLLHSVTPSLVLSIRRPFQQKHTDFANSPTSPRVARPSPYLSLGPPHPFNTLPHPLKYSISSPGPGCDEAESVLYAEVPSVLVNTDVTRTLRSISYDNSSAFEGVDGDILIKCSHGFGNKSSWAFQSIEKDDVDIGGKKVDLTDEDSNNSVPHNINGHDRFAVRRNAVIRRKKLMPQVRHSRSLETLCFLDDIVRVSRPQDTPNKMQRLVVLTGGFFESGHRVIGGRGNDVFIVCESTKNSCPLKTGDQLIKIEARSVIGMTYATLVDLLKLHSVKNEMTLLVIANTAGYEKLQSKNIRDHFYVRATFASRSTGPKVLGFQKGDILLVTDTCPDGKPGYWYAMKVTKDGHSTEGGYVPTEPTLRLDLQDMEQQSLKSQTVAAKSRTTSTQQYKYMKCYQPVNLIKGTIHL